jgi:hypothetical protein
MKKEISSLNKVASELEKLSKISKVYTPQQQEMFTKINSMFHRLSMNGQKDTTEKLNFKNGDLIMSKVDGKVMIEYKGNLKPFKNQVSLEKFIEDNLDYYMNKIDGKIKRSSSMKTKIESVNFREAEKLKKDGKLVIIIEDSEATVYFKNKSIGSDTSDNDDYLEPFSIDGINVVGFEEWGNFGKKYDQDVVYFCHKK